jgi:hypothetical protein
MVAGSIPAAPTNPNRIRAGTYLTVAISRWTSFIFESSKKSSFRRTGLRTATSIVESNRRSAYRSDRNRSDVRWIAAASKNTVLLPAAEVARIPCLLLSYRAETVAPIVGVGNSAEIVVVWLRLGWSTVTTTYRVNGVVFAAAHDLSGVSVRPVA